MGSVKGARTETWFCLSGQLDQSEWVASQNNAVSHCPSDGIMNMYSHITGLHSLTVLHYLPQH